MSDSSDQTPLIDDALFRTAADLAGLGVWVFEPASGRVLLSRRAAELYGTPGEAPFDVDRWRTSVDPGDRPRAAAAFNLAAESHPEGVVELAITTSDGARRQLRETWRVDRWTEGRPGRFLGVVADISEQIHGERRRRELLQELQHRLKGVLALVRSLARRTAAHTDTVEEFVAHFDGRLGALTQVETTLARTSDGRADLEELIRQELVQGVGSETVSVEGPAVRLRGKFAGLVTLAIHELTDNSVKFGALGAVGAVSVTWRLVPAAGAEPERLVLTWAETGLTETPAPGRRGFGLGLIERGLPYELDARVDTTFGPDGLICRIELPLRPRGSS